MATTTAAGAPARAALAAEGNQFVYGDLFTDGWGVAHAVPLRRCVQDGDPFDRAVLDCVRERDALREKVAFLEAAAGREDRHRKKPAGRGE